MLLLRLQIIRYPEHQAMGGWYTSPIIIKPLGDTYDMFADGTASIEVNNKKESIQIQLKNSQTGQLTSQRRWNLKVIQKNQAWNRFRPREE